MAKIVFMGAGSTVFAKNVIGDCMLTPSLKESEIALYDIDPIRLKESKMVMDNLNENFNAGRAVIKAYCGISQRRAALKGAGYVVNAIQVGGYKPSTVIDFEIPRKYGLRQTIGDTLGIGGIFRGLRTMPVVLDFARDMEAVCPDAWFLNYTNPMSMLTGVLLQATSIKTVGLCHSVEGCAPTVLKQLGMLEEVKNLNWKIAGINHQAWLLEVRDGKKDLYPEMKRRAEKLLNVWRKSGTNKHSNMVRLYMMLKFGYYITESSEHNAEYNMYFIKRNYPGLIKEFNIPLDEYLKRCDSQVAGWKKQRKEILGGGIVAHERSGEYGAGIIEALETNKPIRIGGNVLNKGFITNLPPKAVVEVPCLVYGAGIEGSYIGDLPEQLAGLNRAMINVQQLTIEAALTGKKEAIYHAAYLDPHTASELSLDEIADMCDDLIKAHGKMLPKYR